MRSALSRQSRGSAKIACVPPCVCVCVFELLANALCFGICLRHYSELAGHSRGPHAAAHSQQFLLKHRHDLLKTVKKKKEEDRCHDLKP